MSNNNRTYWAIQGASIAPNKSLAFTGDNAVIHGLQSLGITSTFNLEQVFELGQLAIYENIEDIPDVEVTMEKVIDGYPLIYHLATQDASSDTLAGRSNAKCGVLLNIYSDIQDSASGVPRSEVFMSGMYVSSLSYTCPVDGNSTESVTLVGNNKVWYTSDGDMILTSEMFDNTDSPLDANGVSRRENFVFNNADDGTTSLLPKEVEGISPSGTNDKDADGNYSAHVQSVTINTDLGREELMELGRRGPYFRPINFPVEVTCEIEVLSSQGDLVDMNEDADSNIEDQTIIIQLEDTTKLDLGTKNKLSNVTYGGGDAGGGNATTTYSYTTFNDLTVTHDNDPRT